jgi:hypothetical protein
MEIIPAKITLCATATPAGGDAAGDRAGAGFVKKRTLAGQRGHPEGVPRSRTTWSTPPAPSPADPTPSPRGATLRRRLSTVLAGFDALDHGVARGCGVMARVLVR